MKAEEKTVAFMFFTVVMQFVYSLGKKTEKKKNLGVGKGVERDKSGGAEGLILMADNRELQ